MMNRPRVFLDLDGVIVDFMASAMKHHGLDFDYEHQYNWEINLSTYPGTRSEFWEAFDEEFWANLPFTKEAPSLLKLLQGYYATILTSPTLTSATGKQKWMRKNLPEYFNEKRYLIGPDKLACAREGAFLIDDKQETCDDWDALGGTAILVPRPWNRMRLMEPLCTSSVIRRFKTAWAAYGEKYDEHLSRF